MQWLIDMMKEWVESQNYLTIPDFVTWIYPLYITGTVDPNCTCTYHKYGTFNDKDYYVRNDGEWYIWWDGVDRWYISEILGDSTPPVWSRMDPVAPGLFTPTAPATGNALVSTGYGCPHLCFVDHGDIPVFDWTSVFFISDQAWHDLDLSGIVSPGTKGVLLYCYIRANAASAWFQIRQKGNVNTINIINWRTAVANLTISYDGTCPVGPNRMLEYRLQNVGWLYKNVAVKAWWF